jgi:mRNA-degrading endonuclease RelE of RelBE toxin-antitoxin system
MAKEWDRADYIEEDVRRHSEEIRQLTKLTQENASILKALIESNSRDREAFFRFTETMEKTLDQRGRYYEDHEKRLRNLEAWKSRSGAYWAVFAAVLASGASFVTNSLSKLI